MDEPKTPQPETLGEMASRARHGERFDLLLGDARQVLSLVPAETMHELEAELGTRALLDSSIELAKHARGPLAPEVAADALKARAELDTLQSDTEFLEKYLGGDRQARDRMARLQERANPE